jgi:[ribosomal protein S18]-alanine N-acetyltransferase
MDDSIRPCSMTLSDLDEVLAIEGLSFGSPWSRTMFVQEMSNEAAFPIVFKAKGTVVGYICFWQVMDEGHLLNIAVHPDSRTRGLGTFMMHHLERLCRDRGLQRILLDVGRRNTAARNLYRKCGYHSIGFRKNYYAEVKDDALVMEKRLSSSKDEDRPKTRSAPQEAYEPREP